MAYSNIDIDMVSEEKVDLDVLQSRLLTINRNKWLLEASTEPKLRTYLDIYNNEDTKALISTSLSRSQRSLLSKLKLGILPFEIECGRWKDDPIETRLCRLCCDGLHGDEYHFTLFCDKLIEERTAMFSELVEKSEDLLKSLFQRDHLKTTG